MYTLRKKPTLNYFCLFDRQTFLKGFLFDKQYEVPANVKKEYKLID